MRRVVSVAGPSNCTQQEAALAEQVGRLLAERGAVVTCGGRGGVMEAACRGAQQAGGVTIGLLPGTDHQAGNAYLTAALPTGLGEARNALVAQVGQALIAIGGGPGTLSEIALAVKAGRRVVTLRSWKAQSGDQDRLEVLVAESPDQAVAVALEEAD